MNKTLSLLKTILKDTYSFSKMKKKSRISSGFLFVFAGIIIISYVAMYTSGGIDFLLPLGYEKIIPTLAYMLCAFVIIMLGFSTTKNVLFESKDNDMLLSLPIKNSQIFTARTLSVAVLNYVMAILIFLVCNIAYMVKLGLGVKYFLYSLILTLFVPLIPTIISILVGYIIAEITSRMKNPKVFEIIINFIFPVGIFLVMIFFSNITQNLLENVDKIKEFFAGPGYFIKTIYLTLVNYDINALLVFLLISLGVFILAIAIFSISYKKIIYRSKKKFSVTKKSAEYTHQSKTSALLKKEFKLYLGSSTYVVNTFFGVILFIILTIYVAVTKGEVISNIMSMEGLEFISITYFMLIFVTFMICTSSISSSSISIEGKKMWILKTIPIDIKQVIDAKVLLNVLVVAPISIICTAIISVILHLGAIKMLLICSYVFMLTYCISMFGVICNLKYPKLDWQNETQAIKQSMSVFVSVMGTMLFAMIFTGVFAVLNMYVSEITALLIINILYIIITIILNRILYLRSIKKFYSIY